MAMSTNYAILVYVFIYTARAWVTWIGVLIAEENNGWYIVHAGRPTISTF